MSQDGGKLRCRIAQVPQYCVYSAMPKSPNQLSNCLNRAKTSVILSVFDGVLCDVRAYTVTVFLPSLNMNYVPEKLFIGQ